MLAHWQTTAAGIGLICTALGMGISVLAGGEGDLKVALATLLAGLGLLRAADASKVG